MVNVEKNHLKFWHYSPIGRQQTFLFGERIKLKQSVFPPALWP